MFSINRSFRGLGRGDIVLPGWAAGLSPGQVGLLITNTEDVSWADSLKDFLIIVAKNTKGGNPHEEEKSQIAEGVKELNDKGCTFVLKLTGKQEIKNPEGIRKLIELIGDKDWLGTNGQPNPRVSTLSFFARVPRLLEMTKLVDAFTPDDAYGRILSAGIYKWQHITAEKFNEIIALE